MKENRGIRSLLAISIILICFILSSCGGFEAKSALVSGDRNAKWVSDIDLLAKELPAKHKNLFFQLSKDSFIQGLDNIKGNVGSQSDEELKVELSKLIASVGDSHTVLYFNTQKVYPVRLYWFKEGIFATDTTEEYKQIKNLRLTKVNGKEVTDVLNSLKQMISHENIAQFKSAVVQYLVVDEILKGLKIVSSDTLNLSFMDDGGKEVQANLKAEQANNIKFIGAAKDNANLPLYRKNPGKYYWFEYISQYNTIYFQYNSCANMKEQSFKDFNKDLFDVIDQNKVEKLIIDLRNNGGGNSSIMDPFFKELKKRSNLTEEGELYVVLGRKTFSSAILNALDFKNNTPAVFIGEPTGGKPNHYGEVKKIQLVNTGITVSYSSKYFKYSKEDTDSLLPDITVEPSIIDYVNNQDAILDRIITGK